jgi:drug/metabolite transporter (DMT)-like permease
MAKALFLGIAASLFFALTFVLNRSMQLSGGHWIWTSSLRFVFMLPMLFALAIPNGRYRRVLAEIRKDAARWILWSTVAFGLFYSLLCAASAYGPSWMVASTWQITIVAGILLTPLTHGGGTGARGRRSVRAIPARQLLISLVIIAGVFLAQYRRDAVPGQKSAVMPVACIVLAAFAYPLGNRKMMAVAPESMSTLERTLGMTLCSMPFWGILMCVALARGITPTGAQAAQGAIVALSSGVIATLLFFRATELVRSDPAKLAVVESTQAGEVLFAAATGVAFLGDEPPSGAALAGVAVIVAGMLYNGAPAGKRRRRARGSDSPTPT